MRDKTDDSGFKFYEIEKLVEDGWMERPEIPSYVIDNMNAGFQMRDYQKEALENFMAYFEEKKLNHEKQIWTLFHMATGSGKTYIMACLILYFYQKGYRDFLFFVNQDSIIKKTEENFLNKASRKYLFRQDINMDGEFVPVRAVSSFRQSENKSINILFQTIQGLHYSMNHVKEGNIAYSDFAGRKVVIISDEAHHINADTRKLKGKEKKKEQEAQASWEQTVKRIFYSDRDNVLLEFTATCDLKNVNIAEKYRGNPAEIVYNYPLLQFRNSGYTKELYNMRTTLDPIERTIQAMLLSQYRLKLFEKYKISNSKPVILLKAADTTENCDAFYEKFVLYMKSLNENVIRTIRNQANGIVKKMFDFFLDHGISDADLVEELKVSFAEEHLAKIHSQVKNKEELLVELNNLEDPVNPYRMIFTVDMLNEGWDVLNLFDIVRLYDERKDSNSYISKTTVSEAQLIGRGARYFPFALKSEIQGAGNESGRRKFDVIPDHEMRLCETLMYHCIDESRYIDEIKRALKEEGFAFSEEPYRFEYKLKDEFKRNILYQTGKLFINDWKTKENEALHGIPESFFIHSETTFVKKTNVSGLYEEERKETGDKVLKTTTIKMKDVEKRVVLKAMRQYPVYRFDRLKSYFPNLSGHLEFISSDQYLGRYEFTIHTEHDPTQVEIYEGVLGFLDRLSGKILGMKDELYGTYEFREVPLSEYVSDSVREKRYTEDEIEEKEGEGISQNAPSVSPDYRLDLSKEEWFVFNDNYGTTEEKRFVKFFANHADRLKAVYDNVYLIRNERKLHLYSFDGGRRFEPDYILILGNNAGNDKQKQVFIEVKGEHLRKNDEWKETFLLQLQEQAKCISESDISVEVVGLPFFTHGVNEQGFRDAFESL